MSPSRRRGLRNASLLGAAGAITLALVHFGPTASAVSARPDPGPRPLSGVPAPDPARGLVYGGLIAARTGPCVGSFEVANVRPTMCTHGPDAPPVGLDVKRSVAPLPAGVTASALPVCEGDGSTGRRVEVLYIHGSTSRYTQFLETFRSLAEQVDTIYNESARETGGERHVRYVTELANGQCRPVVRDVQIADSALNANDWAPLLNAVKALPVRTTAAGSPGWPRTSWATPSAR